MSSMTKISLLALIGTAAAVPQYGHGGHSKFHSLKSKTAYPTGGWGSSNSTRVPHASGTGTGVYDDKTTTLPTIVTSTHQITSTIYGGAASSSAAAYVQNVVSSGAAQCGGAVTITEIEKIYVTVTPAAPAAPSSAFGTGYETLPSSKVIVSLAHASVSSKAPEVYPSAPAAVSSKVPEIYSSASAAVSSKVPEIYSSASNIVSSKVAQITSSKAEGYPVPTSSAADVTSSVKKPVASSSTVISSAAAYPTGTAPTYSGTKRGLAYNDATLCKSFGGASYGFAYNWGQTEGKDLGTNFVPMMHKPSDSSAAAWLANVDTAVKGGSKAVMGFNEPDHVDQANLTPEAACSAWTEYMNPIASAHSGVTIIGPSVTNGGAPMGLDWLKRFHSACPSAIIHATNIHFYDIPSDDTITRFKSQIETAAAEYNKPVWVTEFGLNTGSATEEQAASFLKQAMEYMDGSDLVQGYSYFMVAEGADMINAGSAVGKAYAAASY